MRCNTILAAVAFLTMVGGFAVAPAAAGLYVVPIGAGGTYYVYETRGATDFNSANTAAAAAVDPLFGSGVSGNLVRIDNAAENAYITGMTGGTVHWIGATDQVTEGSWNWTSGSPTLFWLGAGSGAGGTAQNGLYTNWNGTGEPNDSGGEDAAAIYSGGVWNDLSVSSNQAYIIQYKTNLASVPATTGALVLDPSSGKYYERDTTARTWVDAKAFADSRSLMGVQGRLVQVNDLAENQFIRSLGGGWIGLTDNEFFGGSESIGSANKFLDGWVWTGPADTSGTYIPDSTLTSTGFTNWNGGEPNGTTEDAVEVRSADGLWNDLSHTSGSYTRYGTVEYNLAQSVPLNIRVRTVNGTGLGSGIGDIQNLLNGQSTQVSAAEGMFAAVNLGDPEGAGGGRFTGYAPFPNDTSAGDNNFAVKACATVVIPTAGDYTFGIQHDDQAQLVVDRGADAAHVYTTAAQTGEHFTTVNFSNPGTYNLYLAFAEIGGNALLELYSAPGTLSAYDSTFQLVGDTLNGGLATTALRDIHIDGGRFTVRDVKSTGSVGNLAQTDDLLDNGSPGITSETTGLYDDVNFLGSSGNGHFGLDSAFPNGELNVDSNYFAVEATGTLVVSPEAEGWWTFGVNSDDGFRLSIDGADFTAAYGDAGTAIDVDGNLYFNAGRGVDDSLGTIFLGTGKYDLNLRYWEGTGGSALELWYAAGVHTSFDSSFELLTAVVPEPSTVAMLLGLGVVGLAGLLRRRVRR